MAAYTTIDDPSAYFQTALYTGNAGYNTITNDGNSDLAPDLIWGKCRSTSKTHFLYDTTRGAEKRIESDNTGSEDTSTNGVLNFYTDGFRLGSGNTENDNNETYVAWQWKANGGTTSSNTDGDLTSTVQFNSTAGFSIITYTGKSPIEPLDVGHGMGEVPDMFIIKNRSGSRLWAMYHKELTSPAQNRYLILNDHQYGELANSTVFRYEAPTTTIIKTGENAAVNQPNENFVVYAWKERQGFSKFGKYFGGGSGVRPFIYTGFKPAWVMIRNISSASNWEMFDIKRNPANVANLKLGANLSVAENGSDLGSTSQNNIDILSNGFKMRTSSTDTNASGDTYIYIAFAENPFVTSTGVPATAR